MATFRMSSLTDVTIEDVRTLKDAEEKLNTLRA